MLFRNSLGLVSTGSSFAGVILFVLCLLVSNNANALDLASPEVGYSVIEKTINAGGGVAYLPNGDILSFSADYITGPALVITDASGDNKPATPQILQQFSNSEYASFVRVSPSGKFALIGVSGSSNTIYKVDLTTFAKSPLAEVLGNYDLDFIDESHVYISANPGGFSQSAPNVIYWMNLANPSVLKTVVSISGTPSGPVALNRYGDLYYIRSTWSYPAPALSSTLLAFSHVDLNAAIGGAPALSADDSDLNLPIDGGYDLAVESPADVADRVFIAGLNDGILSYDRSTGKLETFLISTNQSADNASFTNVALLNPSKRLTGCEQNNNKLVTGIASHYYADNSVAEVVPAALDKDGDGYTDCSEQQMGSDSTDIGSIPAVLYSPAFATWNGYLKMVNVLELTNRNNNKVSVKVMLYRQDGTLGDSFKVAIDAKAQSDLILNERPAFVNDSYGLVKLEFSGEIDGRVTFYKPEETWGGDIQFAYTLPVSNPTKGESSVSFNTIFPSTPNSTLAGSAAVYNWLSIVNLSESKRQFEVKKFDQQGNILGQQTISLRNRSRLDLDGGHILPGFNQVGLITVRPLDQGIPYLAHLVRYGERDGMGLEFAFPLQTRAGTRQPIAGLISNELAAANWLEVINTGNDKTTVKVKCFESGGSTIFDNSIALNAHAQYHLNGVAILGNSATSGVCLAVPKAAGQITAQSMFYYPDSKTGDIVSISGAPLRQALGKSLTGGYNLFLGMQSELRLANLTEGLTSVTLELYTSVNKKNTKVYSKVLNLQAHQTTTLTLSTASTFNTQSNTYGAIILSANTPASLLAESSRRKMSTSSGNIQFNLKTPVK